MEKRNGIRKTRGQKSNRKPPNLGYYIIVTDTKETEANYINGLRNSIPKEFQERLIIKVSKAKISDLVDESINLAAMHPQYAEPWIIFDRDKVENFDNIIKGANKRNVKTGWSNPCIEMWFCAYFGAMPVYEDSVHCLDGFKAKYLSVTKQKYEKSDTDIYSKLCRFGDEKNAFLLATQKYNEHIKDGKSKPSEMFPATTVHILVQEIKDKTSAFNKFN
ncbi:MAG: RloB family protein [Clostridiales bacterium]|jgi:hypothetical protein|nr:RloB family protein [Clostridiales bacterium]